MIPDKHLFERYICPVHAVKVCSVHEYGERDAERHPRPIVIPHLVEHIRRHVHQVSRMQIELHEEVEEFLLPIFIDRNDTLLQTFSILEDLPMRAPYDLKV